MNSRRLQAPFWLNIQYVMKSVLTDLWNKKIGTVLTVLVIAVSLTIPTISYLLWKNTKQAATEFYPESQITVYLHKTLSEADANLVVEKLRQQEGVAALSYVSRQQSLEDFRAWSGFGSELELLDDNPLPAVVMITPQEEFQQSAKLADLRVALNKVKGVDEVRLDSDWLEKLAAITWLAGRIAVVCTLLMLLAVVLVIGNSIRSDVYSSRANIEVMKLLGATEHFILRPFLYTGLIYGIVGGILAALLSAVTIAYFSTAIEYVANIFAVKYELNGINLIEAIFIIMLAAFTGWCGAWIAAKKHINRLDEGQ
ncbi:permease-like cell division protein FtsX [Testudinibacter aquarius]|uniref:Cell division protein FtsX n=1 Tax=Testudinibacter aquarius TaxID=1524974 RepID=A0A4R3YBV8_9PAST|nr:permease-like cell division protein FtsX [Testudinibacter aquarius]TNG95160.1 cell division protein FtsX [Pasteurellaceae bacterium USgator41]TNG95869.1 cell division protein FtsX [Pasteurellaceae bacterium UScroc12]TNG98963.1 cell division protein FtsX [Pasteurellaceae bacterium UScroc31]TNG99712.1 cell division protein FtsX [Pasteurellaceae bacterium USgator11]KAE9528990.1 cell division protein FtsX [Testudinibacter aquarius]